MSRRNVSRQIRDAVAQIYSAVEDIDGLLDSATDDVPFTSWLREKFNPVLASRIKLKDLSHTEALDLLKLIHQELNNHY